MPRTAVSSSIASISVGAPSFAVAAESGWPCRRRGFRSRRDRGFSPLEISALSAFQIARGHDIRLAVVFSLQAKALQLRAFESDNERRQQQCRETSGPAQAEQIKAGAINISAEQNSTKASHSRLKQQR